MTDEVVALGLNLGTECGWSRHLVIKCAHGASIEVLSMLRKPHGAEWDARGCGVSWRRGEVVA
jgi:hypothetical protein